MTKFRSVTWALRISQVLRSVEMLMYRQDITTSNFFLVEVCSKGSEVVKKEVVKLEELMGGLGSGQANPLIFDEYTPKSRCFQAYIE